MNLAETVDARAAELTPEETRRYGRHLVLPEVGLDGQRRLKAGRVLLVGAGGLGSPLGLYLAAAGVGTLAVVDFDRVDVTNLQRQVLYGEPDLGRPKVEAAAERMQAINPHINIEALDLRLDQDNVLELVDAYDLVVDGSDNFTTRYLVNDACVLTGTPDIWGAVLRFEGQLSVFAAQGGPCYRCLFAEPPPPGTVPSCAEGGVFGVLPGIIGALQATEVIKLLAGVGEPMIGRLLVFDALGLRFREVRLPRDPRCPLCGDAPRITAPIAHDPTCVTEPTDTRAHADEELPVHENPPFEIDVRQLQAWRSENQPHVLVDVREPHEHDICNLGDAKLIPLREIPTRFGELDSETLTVVHCHHGGRSAQAVAYLRQQGFTRVTNLGGGIDAWSLEIDPSVPRY